MSVCVCVLEVNLGPRSGGGEGRGRGSGPGNDASPERPRGSREEAYCPGGAQMCSIMFIKLNAQAAAWIGADRVCEIKAQNAYFYYLCFRVCVSTLFVCLMEQQHPLINTVSAMPGRRADWRPVGVHAHPAPRWPFSQPSSRRTGWILKRTPLPALLKKNLCFQPLDVRGPTVCLFCFFFPFVLSGRA